MIDHAFRVSPVRPTIVPVSSSTNSSKSDFGRARVAENPEEVIALYREAISREGIARGEKGVCLHRAASEWG